MLTYEDCVSFSGLTTEEIAAIARHEHLPEMAALEMGACLCLSSEGRWWIRQMIIGDSENACQRGDTRTAARLGLVLHHFIDNYGDRDEAASEPGYLANVTAPSWLRERVDAYLSAMLAHFGVDRATAQKHFGPEMETAATCCAVCTETGRCRRFLTGAAKAETPPDFCPNAPLFAELARGLRSGEYGVTDEGRAKPD